MWWATVTLRYSQSQILAVRGVHALQEVLRSHRNAVATAHIDMRLRTKYRSDSACPFFIGEGSAILAHGNGQRIAAIRPSRCAFNRGVGTGVLGFGNGNAAFGGSKYLLVGGAGDRG